MNKTKYKQTIEIEKKLQEYIEHINKLETKIAELNVKYSNAQIELNEQRNIKKLLRNLYDSVDQKILNLVDKRGQVRKPKIRTGVYKIDLNKMDTLSIEGLILEAKKYDISANFRYKSLRNPKKLQYRVIDKMYRTTRNIIFSGAKYTYKTIKNVKSETK